jgi:chaperone BCS1
MLFTNLPARCIVLLEDIDTAGLIRDVGEEDQQPTGKEGENANQDWNVVNLTRALKKANQMSEEEKKKGISLSGLLNIIDGMLPYYLSKNHRFGFQLFHFPPNLDISK